MNGTNLYLKPDEAKFLAMAVLRMLDDVKRSSQNVKYNWNPEARKYLKEMIESGSTLKIKMGKMGFDMRELPDVLPGEEQDYLTQES